MHRVRGALICAVSAICLVALITGVEPARSQQASPPLEPDLVTRPFPELRVTEEEGETYLRLSNLIANQGAGPLEIFPEVGTSDCDADPAEDRFAYQRVFLDANENGTFERGIDTESQRRLAGCMVYHAVHDHWHFDAFSRYQLLREGSGELASQSTKVSFCVMDTDLVFASLPGSPETRYYPQGGSGCDADAVEGISIGWADLYKYTLSGQQLRVTDQRAGRYCLVSTADPVDRLLETNDTNNVFRQRIQLDPGQGTVSRLNGTCQFREGPPGDPTCSDSVDNDGDGLVDLDDSDCRPRDCASAALVLPSNETKIVCLYSPGNGSLASTEEECRESQFAGADPVLNSGACLYLPPG